MIGVEDHFTQMAVCGEEQDSSHTFPHIVNGIVIQFSVAVVPVDRNVLLLLLKM